jgi:hypothetical protein
LRKQEERKKGLWDQGWCIFWFFKREARKMGFYVKALNLKNTV